ncbi:MAG: hypothetical protein GQ559_12590 [Desulfobulbaceae bacterium]|nr:hypothetical protein [Desulfobulbaceae bacterium]
MVEITGGEPLLQKGVYPLMHQLLELGHTVLLETNGSLSIAEVPDEVVIILDIKCPDSGMEQHVYRQNLEILRERRQRGCSDELKFVLNSEQDFSWSLRIVKEQKLEGLMPVLFSPVQDRLSAARLADLILKNRINVRLQLQLHTILWPEQDRGV